MKKIICFGEALVDFLNTTKYEVDGVPINRFEQFPGGAPANVAVAVAKLGGTACFMGQVGLDPFGDFLLKTMSHYGVDLGYALQTNDAQTASAFVFLDESSERTFLFHRNNTADLILKKEQIERKWFQDTGIFHFCSNTLTQDNARNVTQFAIVSAESAGALVSFDVNLRHNLWESNEADRSVLNGFISHSKLLKFSLEELAYLSCGNPRPFIEQLLSNSASLIVVTNGSQPVRYYAPGLSGSIDVPNVHVVDTTAGGDAFVGGLLYKISRAKGFNQLIESKIELEKVLSFAIHCGAIAVSRKGAYPALATLEEVRSF